MNFLIQPLEIDAGGAVARTCTWSSGHDVICLIESCADQCLLLIMRPPVQPPPT